jgi:hypothetical protein
VKDDLRQWLDQIATHPAAYGLAAAVARWFLGDRDGGIKGLLGYISASLLVAWAAALWIADEGLMPARGGFYLLLISFVAKDVLVVVVSLAAQFRLDPFGVISRVHDALRGGPKP